MTTQEIATKLVALCREGKYDQVYSELFSPDVFSIEPEGSKWGTVQGIDAIHEKGKKWNEMVEEFISGEVSDPIVAGDYFTCSMKTKIRMKGVPGIVDMDEICLYRVKESKVISEQFFYVPMAQEA